MITLKDLDSLYYIDGEINDLRDKIAELRSAAEKGTADITGMPHGGGTGDRVCTMAILLTEYTDMLNAALYKKIKESKRIHKYILAVEDAQTRRIMYLRYIQCEPWQTIANHIGGNTAASVRMRVIRYVRAHKKP